MFDRRKQHELGNVANWRSKLSLKSDRERCDRISVDHGLEVFPQSKVAAIQIIGFRRPSCRKFLADDFVVTEIAAEQLFHATDGVWRSSILHKHFECNTSPCLKNRNNRLL